MAEMSILELEKAARDRDKYKSFIQTIANMDVPEITTGDNPGIRQLRIVYNGAVKILEDD